VMVAFPWLNIADRFLPQNCRLSFPIAIGTALIFPSFTTLTFMCPYPSIWSRFEILCTPLLTRPNCIVLPFPYLAIALTSFCHLPQLPRVTQCILFARRYVFPKLVLSSPWRIRFPLTYRRLRKTDLTCYPLTLVGWTIWLPPCRL
jgi:hypothetical protein